MRVIVGFSPGWRLTRWATDGPVGHAFVVFDSKDFGCKAVMEARVRQGVVTVPAHSIEDLEGKTIFAYEMLQFRPYAKQAFVQEMFDSSGQKYDFLPVGLWLFAGIGNKLAGEERWVPRWDMSMRDFCSEIIAECLIAVEAPGKWHGKMHPNALLEAIRESEAFRTYGGKLV